MGNDDRAKLRGSAARGHGASNSAKNHSEWLKRRISAQAPRFRLRVGLSYSDRIWGIEAGAAGP